jgi:hypothetical protein
MIPIISSTLFRGFRLVRKLSSDDFDANHLVKMMRNNSIAERDHRAFYRMVVSALTFFSLSSIVIVFAMI